MEKTVTTMTADLGQLADTIAIQQLVARYGRAVDWMDIDAMSACFASGAVVRFGTMEIPASDFCGFWRGMGSGLKARHHHLGQPVIALKGDQAFVEVTAIVAGTAGGDGSRLRNFMECNRYLLDLWKTSQGWQIKAARILITWSHGAPMPQGLETGGPVDHDVDLRSPFFVKLE